MLRTNTVLFSEYDTAMGWDERGAVEYPWSHQEYRRRKIGIPSLKGGRRGHGTSQHAITKARSKTSNLVFNARNVIVSTAIWNMTIGPCYVLTSRRAMRVEQGWLP